MACNSEPCDAATDPCDAAEASARFGTFSALPLSWHALLAEGACALAPPSGLLTTAGARALAPPGGLLACCALLTSPGAAQRVLRPTRCGEGLLDPLTGPAATESDWMAMGWQWDGSRMAMDVNGKAMDGNSKPATWQQKAMGWQWMAMGWQLDGNSTPAGWH